MVLAPPERCRGSWPAAALAIALLLWAPLLCARLDLARAQVVQLENGLTVAVLEEHALPVVSVQMLYRVGAKHEPFGQTGLAHFLEHMAFRSTENFPDTEVVSSIYAAGGEWHGYTWLDQTTYFATVPREQLDLLLRIEADRMVRLLIPADDVEAERGAVLAEMHGYENDPNTVLLDHVLYLSFLAHPYRNNTIGWESDVSGITHAELVAFYQRHYQPGNAVLAVVGDIQADQVLDRVRQLFGDLPGAPATPEPRTEEPPQNGLRRIELRGNVARPQFRMVWRAPSVHSPDFAAFLVAQELLAGGSGVSFLQNDWGTPARPGSPLDRLGADITTWYPPSRQDYVFAVSGVLPDGMDTEVLQDSVQAIIAAVAARPGEDDAIAGQVATARRAVERELLFDLQTSEDAAHQLASFLGFDALPVLLGLPEALARVQAADVRRAVEHWLGADQRTIGWMLPRDWSENSQANVNIVVERTTSPSPVAAWLEAPAQNNSSTYIDKKGLPAPASMRLRNGVPALIQPSPLSPTALLQVVVAGAVTLDGVTVRQNEPLWGLSTLEFRMLPAELPGVLSVLPQQIAELEPSPVETAGGDDPGLLLQQYFEDLLGLHRPPASGRPLLLALSGDIDGDTALRQLDETLGEVVPGTMPAPVPLNATARMVLETAVDQPLAQERLGYVARAPGPAEDAAPAWWLALYILSHDYEGRLGKEAISRRGLVYYIDATYGSNGRGGWVTLDMGVDPARVDAMRGLLQEELARLLREPPSEAELAEARQHLLGRCISAAQGNDELAGRLAREWLWYGELPDCGKWRSRLDAVDREQVLAILPDLTGGAIVTVRYREP